MKTRNTDAVDEDAWQNEIENIEEWSTPHFDDVGYVWIGFWTARVVLLVVDGFHVDQVEFSVRLIVA